MLFLGIKDVLKSAGVVLLRNLCAQFCEIIYRVIAFAYELFMKLATFELLASDTVTGIYKRVTMVLTIVMLFYIIFEFVKYLIQPDTLTDKEKGISKLPMRLLAVVVLIAFVPNIFTYAFKIQNAIINNQLLYKIIIGKDPTTAAGGSVDNKKIGRIFSWQLLSTFYYVDENVEEMGECGDGVICEGIVATNKTNLIEHGNLDLLTLGLDASYESTEEDITVKHPSIHFDALLAVLIGGFVAYMLVLYCVDVAARVIQLAYLQLIAPIAIIGMLSPKKDNMFTKWLAQCGATYLDVFIRLTLVYLVMFLSTLILGDKTATNLSSTTWEVKIALILGLFVVAKRAPKMLEELFPKSKTAASGNFGLKAGDRNLGRALGTTLGLATGAAVGAATGFAQGIRGFKAPGTPGRKALNGLTGMAWGVTRGTLGGAGRGLWNGGSKSSNEGIGKLTKNLTTGAKGISKSNKTFGNKAEVGYTMEKQIRDKVGGYFSHSRKEDLEVKKKQAEATAKERDTQNKRRSEDLERAESKAMKEGKYYGSTRLKDESEKRAAIKGRITDLDNPNSAIRQQFKVGGEKQDAAAQTKIQRLQQARDRMLATSAKSYAEITASGVTGEALGIKKMDYYDPTTGALNTAAYEKAVENAYKKRQDAKIYEKYQQSLQRQGLVYKDQDEVDTALGVERQKAGKQLAESDDSFLAAYYEAARGMHSGGTEVDQVILDRDEIEKQQQKIHNDTFDEEHQINKDTEVNNVWETMLKQAAFDAAPPGTYANLDAVPATVYNAFRYDPTSNPNGITVGDAEVKWRKDFVKRQYQAQQVAANDINAELDVINREVNSAGGSK